MSEAEKFIIRLEVQIDYLIANADEIDDYHRTILRKMKRELMLLKVEVEE